MVSLLFQILPVAFVITINPVPIIAALIMSTTRKPLASGLAYIGTLLVVMALFGLPVSPPRWSTPCSSPTRWRGRSGSSPCARSAQGPPVSAH
jgi:hypothetical protein